MSEPVGGPGGERAGTISEPVGGPGGERAGTVSEQVGSPGGERADTAPLPPGFRVAIDAAARELEPGLWFGGSPARVLRLTDAGQAAWRELRAAPVCSAASGMLARRLTDAGLAHPRPPRPTMTPDVTVVVPAYDRAHLLDRCLAALGHDNPVLVVDDGSADEAAVAEVAARHGARLLRRAANGGPAAARNTALAAMAGARPLAFGSPDRLAQDARPLASGRPDRFADGELVAFIDSDCVPAPGWITALASHFADPLVAAAAPRITALAAGSWAGRYTAASGALDLGPLPARVQPRSRVAYVPTAALVVRRAALLAVARDGQIFDEAMRCGEDVDLVWRLHEAGWRIRYDPAVVVRHHEPATWPALLARRYRYGTSAAPLASRHPGDVPPLVLHPWPAATAAALIARRPVAAAAAFGASVLTMHQTLRRARVPRRGAARAMLTATGQTWLGMGRYATQFAAPLLAVAVAAPGRQHAGRPRGRGLGRRAIAASLLLGPPLAAWLTGSRQLDPARFALGRVADDIAYGLGVWSGCLSQRTAAPVRPVIAWHPVRIEAAKQHAPSLPTPRKEATIRMAPAE